MKTIISRIRDFIGRFKGEKWFRYLTIISVLVGLCAGVSIIDDFRNMDEKPPDDKEEKSVVYEIIEESAVHIVLIGFIGAGLVYVKHTEELKLKEKK